MAPPLNLAPGPASTKGSFRAGLALAPPALFAAWSVALVVGYVALDGASFVFAFDPVPVKPWNPQAGLAVAFVYAGGLRYAFPLLGAAWLSESLLRHPGAPMFQIIGALTLTLTLTLTALAMRRRTFSRGMSSVASVRDFLLIAAAGAALASAAYVGAYVAFSRVESSAFFLSLLYECLGDLVGIVVASGAT